jgi:hypothetical protein
LQQIDNPDWWGHYLACPDCKDGWQEPSPCCENCANMAGHVPPPNSDRVHCLKKRSILDGWPHWSWTCESYHVRPGKDEAILCPACKAADDAKAKAPAETITRCPFCKQLDGEVMERKHRHPAIGSRFWVHCNCCEANGPETTTAAGAIESWNTDRPLRFEVRCPDAITNPTARFPSEESADEYIAQDGCPECEVHDRKEG